MDNETNLKEYEEITSEYLYLTIPADYVCVYHKLLTYMADFGKDQIDDCTSSCKGNGKNIITCWNLFQSAVAAYNLDRKKEADFFINYITKQLDNLYSNTGKKTHTNLIPVKITDDGRLKAIVGCGNDIKFYVDFETKRLYEEYLNSSNDNQKYEIINGHLTYTNK